MIALTAGFLIFHIIEKLTAIHSAHETEYASNHTHPQLGVVSALALSAHSFFDGIGIGLAFQSPTQSGSPSLSPASHTTSPTASTPSR